MTTHTADTIFAAQTAAYDREAKAHKALWLAKAAMESAVEAFAKAQVELAMAGRDREEANRLLHLTTCHRSNQVHPKRWAFLRMSNPTYETLAANAAKVSASISAVMPSHERAERFHAAYIAHTKAAAEAPTQVLRAFHAKRASYAIGVVDAHRALRDAEQGMRQ